jgi:beta-phosphoglucomutase-like phosphatase (HAD superfamily)
MLEMMERKNRYYLELLKQVTPADLLPGARSLLDALRAAGMKIAIGSASKNAREVVQRLQIASCIDALADGYSVVRPKPAPDLFVYAAGLVCR